MNTNQSDLRAQFKQQVDGGYNAMASWATDPQVHNKTPQPQLPPQTQHPMAAGSMMSQMNQTLGPAQTVASSGDAPNGPITQPLKTADPAVPIYKNKKLWFFCAILALAAIIGGYFFYKRVCRQKSKKGADEDEDENSELAKFRRMAGARGAAAHFPNPAHMNNMMSGYSPAVPPPCSMPVQPQPHAPQPQVPQPHVTQYPQQVPPPQPQGRREQQHPPPAASSGFPQAGAVPTTPAQGASEPEDPMFTKLSDLP